MSLTHFPHGIQASPVVGGGVYDIFCGTSFSNRSTGGQGNIFFVDGDNGLDGNPGTSPDAPFASIGAAVAKAAAGATIFVKARKIAAGGTDPVNYAETVIIGPSLAGLKIIGLPDPAQGFQPQMKKGGGSTAHITVRAPGCLIYGLTINMAGSTAGGILLDDDGSTKTAFGTVIKNCLFKGNANLSSGAGAIAWNTGGGAWQTVIQGCVFFACMTGINILGTGGAVPKNILIEDCVFFSDGNGNVDADIMFNAGSGANSVMIRNCEFGTVDVPAKSTGVTKRYLDLTQVTNGALVGCRFACIAQGTSAKTFGTSGTGALIPATVRMAGNYGEVGATATTGEVLRT